MCAHMSSCARLAAAVTVLRTGMTLESYVTAHSYDPRTRMTLDLVTGMRLHAPQPTCPCLCGKHTLNNLVSGMRLDGAEAR
jgi:hypothetical protein